MNWRNRIKSSDVVKLLENNSEQDKVKGTDGEIDFKPVVKLFNPCGAATMLITECNNDGFAFGLFDLGMGMPELGYISLNEVFSVRVMAGVSFEQDLHWQADKTLSQYADEARKEGRIKA